MKRYTQKPRRKRNYEDGHVLRNILLAVFTLACAVVAALFVTGVLPGNGTAPTPEAPAATPVQAEATPVPQPLRQAAHPTRYDVSISHDSANRSLACAMRLYYVNETSDTLYALYLRLPPNVSQVGGEEAQGSLTVHTAALDGRVAYYTLEQGGEYLHVPFVRELLPGEYTELYLDYTVQLPYRQEAFGWTETAYHLTGVIPALCGYGQGGWETPASGGGLQAQADPDPAEYHVSIEAASRYAVMASAPAASEREAAGDRMVRGYTLKQAPDFSAVIASGYTMAEDTTAAPHIYAYAGGSSAAKTLATEARAAMAFYTERLGAYPYDSITVAAVTLNDRKAVSFPGLLLAPDALVTSSRLPLLRETLQQALTRSTNGETPPET